MEVFHDRPAVLHFIFSVAGKPTPMSCRADESAMRGAFNET
jgi:hypothetical protein